MNPPCYVDIMQRHAESGTAITTPSPTTGVTVPEIARPGIRTLLVAGLALLALAGLTACGDGPWNRPYPLKDAGSNTLYSSFSARPNHLDPAQSYSSNEVTFTGQIYEPPLQYHYLKRPYTLIPLAATQVPEPYYLDAAGNRLPADAAPEDIVHSVYEIEIQPGIRYQPHPAFARDENDRLRYHALTASDLSRIYAPGDFGHAGTRELVAADYVYQIKRLAHPRLHSPIFGLMSDYIVGLKEYAEILEQAWERQAVGRDDGVYLDLTRYPLTGAAVIDRYRYRITINGKYPQLQYWLAMPFFAPVPPEVDAFYAQPGMKARNITLDWYPVGTGPYMLTVNNPNRQMVMERNPNFHGEHYPLEGSKGDLEAGLLEDAGRSMPFIDKIVFSLEKEDIPYWNKFLQGYYDTSGISSDSFDQAISIGAGGEISLTEEMAAHGISLSTAVSTSIFYTGFNWLDPVVGGDSESARKLRQAISIAVDFEEFISIFLNGRGIPAQSMLPPGIFGHRDADAGINTVVYDITPQGPQRKPITAARRLLAEAGYPEGRDISTGKPLVLYFDTTATGPDDKARLDWLRKQFAKLDIQLVIRGTDYNRFQDKMLKGTAQIYQWGWNADYPDPENFMFLLYGPNSKVEHNGENASNYSNTGYDRLFEQMKNMDNTPERQQLIDAMVDIARHDAPWLWGFHSKQFSLHHAWYKNSKPNLMANNTLKYRRIDPAVRTEMQAAWNQPVRWPLLLLVILLLAIIIPAVIGHRRRQRQPAYTRQD